MAIFIAKSAGKCGSVGDGGWQVLRRQAGHGTCPHALVQRLDVTRKARAIEQRAGGALRFDLLAQFGEGGVLQPALAGLDQGGGEGGVLVAADLAGVEGAEFGGGQAVFQ